jgi:hypothetical protein
MSALPNDLSMVGAARKPAHKYDAAADVLSADIEQPLREKIRPQAQVILPSDGRYQFRQAEPFHLEGILSYKGGYTQVAGRPSGKIEGFTTLTTSVIEGLNVLDVVTADRVVAQISTTHPVYGKGQVPSVTFLGTRFDNLRIDGRRVELDLNPDMLGPRHDDDRSYLDDGDVRRRIVDQQGLFPAAGDLPEWAAGEVPSITSNGNGHRQLNCSVVNGIKGCSGVPFGHVIHVPHFGRIVLGELTVTQTYGDGAAGVYDKYRFRLTMIKIKMGCLAEGNTSIVALDSNGGGSKGGGN